MGVTINNFVGAHPNPNIKITEKKQGFAIVEYQRDIGLVSPGMAVAAYYASQMNIRKRQLVIELSASPASVQAGAMQWMAGNVKMTSGIKSPGDAVGKFFKAAATGETTAKPEYSGTGLLVLEPTYKHLILSEASDWGSGAVLEDGMFLACETSLKQTIVRRDNFGAAVAGGEGLFNMCLQGHGVFCVESRCPKEDLIEIVLDHDEVRIDGNYAVAWSKDLSFTVEKATKGIIGSAVSGEGFVNVYRGTGRIWMEPLAKMPDL